MENSEESSCVTSSCDKSPNLGIESPAAYSCNAAVTQSDEKVEIHEQLKNQLNLKKIEEKKLEEVDKEDDFDDEGEKDSIGWHQDDGFNSGESNGGEEEQEYNINNNDYDKVGNDDDDDDDVEKKDERSNNGVNRRHNQYQYPVRPEAEDCSYYMKTGTCKFGSNCKFNHPVKRKMQVSKEKVKEREEATDRPGQTECKYYLRTGGCKYGKACRYNHSRAKPLLLQAKTAVFPALDLNFLGLPIRPGERECPYYMRNGSCKYGANCRFNHPDPTTVGGSDPLAFSNGGSASLQNSLQSNIASWSSPGGLNETPSFMSIMFSPTQGVPSQNPEWNGYQAPMYPPERSMHQPPAYVISNPATDTNVYAHQQQIQVEEFPERPGQPECSYFMKTGDCKFKSNCKYHHPKNHISKSPPCVLSDKGLPLRPGQNICSYYSRYGICKFGPACKFDHPIQPVSSTTGSADDVRMPFSDSGTKEEAKMALSGNASDIAIQQSV
ncbi:zinc finger CCCH domain-containing protein 43 [Ricinus communis]|uniref:zinc finger CCCH domain-containing protein 43 n=1 Tax=Ricinus communis TaxID=3988 RepID=UPI0007726006|nr:zinc finger CCCH domain-containing protein 43 [Ricinus communis]|eukprot:XP_015581492.1 zinc finger CCCH domain-containing protein 43 [Ricinus communis]